MSRIIWPWKTGEDENFRKSPPTMSEGALYDSLGRLPKYDYRTEVERYNESRWRRGLIDNVVPTTAYGSIAGFCIGVFQSRRSLRHMSRPRVIFTHMYSCGGVALLTTSVHHFLVVSSGYCQKDWHAMLSGCIGGVAFAATGNSSVSRSLVGGMIVGLFYAGACWFGNYWQKRTLTNFLITQQSQDTPVHRVAPELQPMYRAFLFDHRPIEDTDELRRRALLLDRTDTDTRLDARSFLEAVNFYKFFNWCEFPEWWPLKFAEPSEEEKLVQARMKEDAYDRRLRIIQTSEESDKMTSYVLRSPAYQEPKQAGDLRNPGAAKVRA